MAFTLEYDGEEKSFEAWGISQENATLSLVNQGADVFTVEVPGAAVDAAPAFPFEAEVVIRKGRTGSGLVWSGGEVIFSGKCVKVIGDGRPDFEGEAYVFHGPWYDLEESPYQQTVYSVDLEAEDMSEPSSWLSWLVSDLVLYQKVTGPGTYVARNNGQQITDILQHVLDQYSAQGMSAPYQIGTIEPATNLMTYEVRDLKAGEAIRMCLRTEPDATVWFNYGTTPPTINITRRSSAVAVTLAVGDNVKHESIHLAERPDLQARSVVLYFKQTNESNGRTWPFTTKQKHGPNGANHASDPEGGRRVLVQTIDLQGASRTDVFGELKVFAADPTVRAFWKRYAPEFQSYKYRGFAASNIQIKDDLGNAVSLATLGNVLEDGSNIASWMKMGGTTPVVGKQVTITADVAYKQYDVEGSGANDAEKEAATNGILKDQYLFRQLVARVTLTNGTTGDYSAIASEVAGEAVPTGLAQRVYEALALLQYEGSVTVVEDECGTAVTLANVLNLSGGKAAWATMKAQIQSVKFDYGSGRTEVTVGPAKHLGAGDLTELFLINRNRRVYYDPSTQASPEAGRGGNVSLPKTQAKENTTSGLDSQSIMTVLKNLGANSAAVVLSAEDKGIRVHELVNSGTPVAVDATKARIEAILADLPAGVVAKFREVRYKNAAAGCAWKRRWVLCTEEEAVP